MVWVSATAIFYAFRRFQRRECWLIVDQGGFRCGDGFELTPVIKWDAHERHVAAIQQQQPNSFWAVIFISIFLGSTSCDFSME
jgi:hypothetical protein